MKTKPVILLAAFLSLSIIIAGCMSRYKKNIAKKPYTYPSDFCAEKCTLLVVLSNKKSHADRLKSLFKSYYHGATKYINPGEDQTAKIPNPETKYAFFTYETGGDGYDNQGNLRSSYVGYYLFDNMSQTEYSNQSYAPSWTEMSAYISFLDDLRIKNEGK